VRLCLMIEGQEDVTWPQWVALAGACEASGLEALFRSDHYLSVENQVARGSLDAWTTLAGLAGITERIRLGTMVSPATFRHPSVLAKSVVTVDHMSNGRAECGLGAGWHEPEHSAYGFAFADTATRLAVLEEQIEIVHRQWTEEAFDFSGEHYRLKDSQARPKPVSKPHPNLIVGGSGGKRSARIAARWADEYNTVFALPEECRRRRAIVSDAFASEGREPEALTFSLMTGCIVGEGVADLRSRARRTMTDHGEDGSEDSWLDALPEEWVVGTVSEIVEKLGTLQGAGVDRVMLQHQSHEDTEMVQILGERVRSQLE
jgi:F420-dependent oxidoreductase-like protein